MSGPDDLTRRVADRAEAVLARPGAFIEAEDGVYAVRFTIDRRRRPVMRLDEAAFRALVKAPGLKLRPDGGWSLIPRPPETDDPPPGRPGVIDGEKLVMEADGRFMRRRANLGESPLAWLARRRDSHGRPFLTPGEMAAGERLREDYLRAGTLGRLTMDWSAGPRSGGRAPGLDPAERGLAAKQRVRAALRAVGPDLAPMLERICFHASALESAARTLELPRRSGKTVLKLALGRLAQHYGMG